jgi:hypothetical protein
MTQPKDKNYFIDSTTTLEKTNTTFCKAAQTMREQIYQLLVEGKINRDEYRALLRELQYRETMGQLQYARTKT